MLRKIRALFKHKQDIDMDAVKRSVSQNKLLDYTHGTSHSQRVEHTPIKPYEKNAVDLIAFFRNECADTKGRMLYDILQFTPTQIEDIHDFIQWIFPTVEASRFNRDAPVIDDEFKKRFQEDEVAKCNYCKSCKLYLNYIGLDCIDGNIHLIPDGNSICELPIHNTLRVTRVLNSLYQVGNTSCSLNVYKSILTEVNIRPNKISRMTLQYWKSTQPVNTDCTNMLIGAIAGDIIGSRFEFNNFKNVVFPLFTEKSQFTDDTVMTIAVADWLLTGDSLLGILQDYGNRYIDAGYGGMFYRWLKTDDPQPYNSYGNGSAMRVSFVGWAFDTLEKTLDAAKQSAEITHNHLEGIKGAQATAACIYLARTGSTKQQIKEYVESVFGYDMDRTCDAIRPTYEFDETCQGTVPEAIIAFLESTDFVTSIRLAVSLGGDSDTLAAITGGIAEAYYKEIPLELKQEVLRRIPDEFEEVLARFSSAFRKNMDNCHNVAPTK